MSIYDRPYFESERERERSYRDRDEPLGRRKFGRRDEEDDRGPWISRERDEYERGWRDFRGRDRFDRFEDWERPRELGGFSRQRHPRSFGGAAGHGGYAYGRRRADRGVSFCPGGLESEGRFAGRGPKVISAPTSA